MSQGEREPGVDEVRPGEDDEVVRLHEPILRELEDPREGHEPTPTWWVFLVMGLLMWGGYYLGTHSGGFRPEVLDESPAPAVAAAVAPAAPDPAVLGKRVFANCQACHQADGRGVPGTYPPLVGSEWVRGAPEVLVRILLHGVEGSLEVAGRTYNQPMPGWKHLKDEQLAAVATFVRGSFGNGASPVAPELVAAVRQATAERTAPWRAPELAVLPDAHGVAAGSSR